MNDEFFNSLKDNLENRPEPTFKKDAWTRMEEKLVAPQQAPTQTRGGHWWLPLLLLLLFGLAGSNVWLYRQLSQTNNQQVLVQTDTIYHSKVIVQTDTIYQTKIIRETSVDTSVKQARENNYSTFFQPNMFSVPTFLEKNFFSGTNGSRISNSIGSIQAPYTGISSTLPNFSDYLLQKNKADNKDGWSRLVDKSANQEQDKIETNIILNQPLQEIISLHPNFIEWQNNYALPAIEIPLIKRRKTIQQHIYQMRPKTFSLGIKGGYAAVVNSQVDNFKGNIYGLNATIGFSQNFKIWADASFLELIYQSKQIDETLGIPNVALANDEFIFVKAEVSQPAYQFSTGLQYMWNRTGKWKPSLGVGYGVISLVPYEVDYDFNDPINNFEVTFEEEVKRSGLIKGQILFKGGLDYQLNRNWSLQLEGMYRLSNQKDGISSPNILGLRTGLSYQF